MMGKNQWFNNSDITFIADETKEQAIAARAEFQRRHAIPSVSADDMDA